MEMKIRKIQLTALMAAMAIPAVAYKLDWDKIEFWTGSGPNRSALVVQFQDNGPKEAYVWGFRWNPDDYPTGAPSGEDMFRAIAAGNADLVLFTQYTGSMGSTVDGIGFSFPDSGSVLDNLTFDFAAAREDSRISFDYFTPNTLMGQKSAPGNLTSVYCSRAINEAKNTNILEHPINARVYGYPAYDYDWWQPSAPLDNNALRWNAGWYDGYWSYWVGDSDFEELSYSGLGMSSRKLADGQVDAWKYALLDGPVMFAQRRAGEQNPRRETRTGEGSDAYSGASEQWHQLNYSHKQISTGIEMPEHTTEPEITIYSLQGLRLRCVQTTDIREATEGLPGGCYIIKRGNHTTKIMI